MPDRAFVVKSIAEWTSKLAYREAKWRWYRYRSKRPMPERLAARRKWWALRQEALDRLDFRKKQLTALDSSATEMSDAGVAMLVKEEGYVPYAYNDPAKHATFGVGHLIHLGPVTEADERTWGSKGSPKTRAYVMQVFKADLEKYESTVRRAVKVKVSQKQFDAMASLCYNIGRAGFAASSVVKQLNAGNRTGAANAFLMWDNPSMLRPRRERERALFLGGRYT